jgi:phosphatidylserine/phosphatidylglycerophosphate/cardiolipin synthase-like enzyme
MPAAINIPVMDKWKSVIGKHITDGNQVDYLVDGKDTFRAYKDAILTATNSTHYIYLLGWSMDGNLSLDGEKGSSIRELFTKASSKGVQIRLMLWSAYYDSKFLVPGYKGTVSMPVDVNKNKPWIDFVNDLPTGAAILDHNTMRPLINSHHQKVLIVKGTKGLISFCGGIDIHPDRIKEVQVKKPNEDYAFYGGFVEAGAKGSPYNDVHCKIQGKSAHQLLDVFIQRWNSHPEHFALDKNIKEGGKGPLMGTKDLHPLALTKSGKQFVGIKRTFIFVNSKKACIAEHSIQSGMVEAIRAASKFIYIEDQYMISMQAARELRNALKNIQHLTILTTASEISDLPRRWSLRARFINEVMKGEGADKKVRIFYRVKPGSGKKPEFGPMTYIHSKAWVFDDQLAVIGSANLNRRGWESDSEVAAFIMDTMEGTNPSDYSFPQRLRIALWKKHLGIEKDTDVYNGLKHAELWLEKAMDRSSAIRRYNPYADSDKTDDLLNPDFWGSEGASDPGADGLKPCPLQNQKLTEKEAQEYFEGGRGSFGGGGTSGEW